MKLFSTRAVSQSHSGLLHPSPGDHPYDAQSRLTCWRKLTQPGWQRPVQSMSIFDSYASILVEVTEIFCFGLRPDLNLGICNRHLNLSSLIFVKGFLFCFVALRACSVSASSHITCQTHFFKWNNMSPEKKNQQNLSGQERRQQYVIPFVTQD